MSRTAGRVLALALVLGASAAADARAAERRLTAAEFEAYVTGRTLFYAGPGEDAYGAEEYRPGRRVIWTFLDGNCVEGTWYEAAEGLICFLYDAEITAQCWSFWTTPGGLSARYESDTGPATLFELKQSDAPLVCPGPDLGV